MVFSCKKIPKPIHWIISFPLAEVWRYTQCSIKLTCHFVGSISPSYVPIIYLCFSLNPWFPYMANHHQNSSLLKVPKILYHIVGHIPLIPYPSLSRFSWCYPTNCCIKWQFSIIDIPCYGCSRNLSSVETPRDARRLPMESCPQQGTDGACNSIRWGWHPLGGPQGYISGKRLHNYGKSSCYSWGEKNELNRPYSIANCDLNYQRVYVCISIYINMYSH